MTLKQPFAAVMALVLMAMAGLAQAAQDPRELVQDTLDRMTTLIDQNRDRLNKEPEYARQLVREELVPLVDFKRITRMVMGDYFDEASRDQKYRFLDVFKNSLINTYASGVTLYQGQKIEVLPMREEDRKGNYARVRVQGTTDDGKVIPVYFTLFQDGDQWKVVNVFVNGLDLRAVYQAQFAQSMQQYGDLDKAIDNWSAQNADVEEKVDIESAPQSAR
ncbi:phospholipid-binding protein MlaC [Alloalcanivorax sp. C16-1]|uniref:MlaC/ttg2D family ABC transporter substrate-binding protein n=1 Tax=Alloalcanivorax sp. C16-1 TaxID=3390051 RepID=UPI0039708862